MTSLPCLMTWTAASASSSAQYVMAFTLVLVFVVVAVRAVLQALPRPCQWEKVLWAPVRRTTPLPRPYRRYLWSQPPAPPLLV